MPPTIHENSLLLGGCPRQTFYPPHICLHVEFRGTLYVPSEEKKLGVVEHASGKQTAHICVSGVENYICSLPHDHMGPDLI